ncbi:MAG: hypothetical protein AAF539_07405 [Planctomycetota bacterium]
MGNLSQSESTWRITTWLPRLITSSFLVQPVVRGQHRLVRHGWRFSFRRRRIVSMAVVLAASLAIAWLANRIDFNLGRSSFMTGWTLLIGLFLLLALGMRRRLPMLPLGTVAMWTQVHIYTGLFLMLVFAMHAPQFVANVFFLPTIVGQQSLVDAVAAGGVLETCLAWLFAVTSLSGVYGLWASRRIPVRLTAIAADHRFDDVAWHREQLATAAADSIASLPAQSSVHVLGDFYDSHLRRFFRTRPSPAYLIWPNTRRRRRLLSGLTQLNRYLDDAGRDASGRLAGLLRRRDDLDMQFALQCRLRLWVVLHAICSVALVVLGVAHAILATRFMGN